MKKFSKIDLLFPILLGIFFIALVLSRVPLNFPYIVNFDESVAVILAYVTRQGYRLYEQVWHDHLSGLSLLLNSWFDLTGVSLYSARILVLIIGTLTLALFYFLLRIQCGIPASVFTTILLSTSFVAISLSSAILRELPSFFFIVLSIFLAFRGVRSSDRAKYILYLFSAVSFVYSLQIKLSGITAIPTIVLILFLHQKKDYWKRASDIVLWFALVGAFFIIGSLTIFPFSYENIIKSHVSVSGTFSDGNLTLLNLLRDGLLTETVYFIIASVAIIGLLLKRDFIALLPPLAWLGSNLFRFASVSPIWNHYYIHLFFPALWIVGLFLDRVKIGSLFREIKNTPRSSVILKAAMIALLSGQFLWNTLLVVTGRNSYVAAYRQMARNYKPHPIEKILARFKNSDKVLLTDNPHYVYEFFLKTPPETAVITRKRMINQNLNGDFILNVAEKNKPDFIFLYRFEKEFLASIALREFLAKNYVEYPLQGARGKFYILPATWKELSKSVNP